MSSFWLPTPEGHDSDRYFYKDVDDYHFVMDMLEALELEVDAGDEDCHYINIGEISIEFKINGVFVDGLYPTMDPDYLYKEGGVSYLYPGYIEDCEENIVAVVNSLAVGDVLAIDLSANLEYLDEDSGYLYSEDVTYSISFTVTTENPTAFKRLAIVPYATYTGKWKQGVTKNDITTLLIGGDDLAGYSTLRPNLGDHPIKEISYINNSIPVFYDYPYDDPDERGDEFVYGGNIELNGTLYSKWHRSGRGEDRLFYLTPNLVDCEEVWPWKSWVSGPSDLHMYYRVYHNVDSPDASTNGWYVHDNGDSPIIAIGSDNGIPCFWVGPNDPDDPDYGKPDTKYTYLGQETFNGTLYDKWRYYVNTVDRFCYTNIVANYSHIQVESAISDSLNRNINETYLRQDSSLISSFDGTYENMIGKSTLRSWVITLTGTFYHYEDAATYSFTLTTSFLSASSWWFGWSTIKPYLIGRPCNFFYDGESHVGVVVSRSGSNSLGIFLLADDDDSYRWDLQVNTSSGITHTSYDLE